MANFVQIFKREDVAIPLPIIRLLRVGINETKLCFDRACA